jgi:hypothetical protein
MSADRDGRSSDRFGQALRHAAQRFDRRSLGTFLHAAPPPKPSAAQRTAGRRTRRFRTGALTMLLGIAACTSPDPEHTSSSRTDPGASVDASDSSIARLDTVRLPQLCTREGDAAVLDFRSAQSEPETDDMAGYAVRLVGHGQGRWSVFATEAVGSFGRLLPPHDLSVTGPDSQLIEFALAGLPDGIRGPRFSVRASCDSVWGEVQGPYRTASPQAIVLYRVPSPADSSD